MPASKSKLAALNERKKLAAERRRLAQAAKATAEPEPEAGAPPAEGPGYSTRRGVEREQPSEQATASTGGAGRGTAGLVLELESGTSPRRRALDLPTADTRDDVFRQVNRNGVLSLAEIDLAVAQLYPDFDHKPALMRAYKAADAGGSGRVNQREFAQLLRYLVYFNNRWDEFEAVEVGPDRRVNVESFMTGCKALNLDISPAEAEARFKDMDVDGSGVIHFEEFCTFCARKHHQTGASGAKSSPRSRPRSPVPATRSPRQSAVLAVSEGTSGSASTEHELQRLQTELALLEDDNRRLKSKLEGPAMQGQKDQLQQLRELLSQKQSEMSMLEQRQVEVNELFREVHDAKKVLQTLSDDETALRNEVRELEQVVLEHDRASAAQVTRAEEIAQALASAGSTGNHSMHTRLETDLNKCIEKAEASGRQLSAVKRTVASKLREADAKATALARKSKETSAIEEVAAARAKELPVIVASMEATVHALHDAEAELDSKTSAIDAVAAEIRQRIEANTEAIKFTSNMIAVEEKKVAMQKRNRSRMNIKVRPDENLAAALASAKSGVIGTKTSSGGGNRGGMTDGGQRAQRSSSTAASRTPSQAGRAQTPNGRRATRASQPRSAGRNRAVAGAAPSDTPKRAWRSSSGTGAAADARERQLASLTPMRGRTTTPNRRQQQSAQKGLPSTPGAQQGAGEEEMSDFGMQEKTKSAERRRSQEAGLASKEQAMERREAVLEKALQAVEREKAAIAAEKMALEREKKALVRKQKDVEELRQQIEADKEETRQTREELGSLRAAAEEMEARLQQQNDEAVSQLQDRVAKFKEAKALQEQILAEEREKLVEQTEQLLAEKRAWKRLKKSASAASGKSG